MKRGSVVLLDPGCFTPFYDAALASHLARCGWDVEWVTSAWEFEELDAPPEVRTTRLFFRGLHAGGLGRLPAVRRSARLRRALKAFSYPAGLARLARLLARRPPGVLHVQWAHLPSLDAALWAHWRRAGWKIVYTVHDPHPLAGTTPWLLHAAYTRLGAAADAIVVHGHAARNELVARSMAPDRIYVVDPAPAPISDGSMPARAEARQRLGLPGEYPVVLFLGFVKPYKGLNVLLESVAEMRASVPNVQLMIAGAVLDGREVYDRSVARLGLADGVHWSNGYVADADLGSYLAAADVVALPYLDASSSGVALLAQSCSRPVVATRVGDLPELVSDGETGSLVPPGDAHALAGALASLLADGSRAERMGQRGRARIEERFGWPRVAERLDRLYARLLDSPGRRPGRGGHGREEPEPTVAAAVEAGGR